MIEKSAVGLNNYDKLQFLDQKSRLFLEQINVTNLIDRLSFTENEISEVLDRPEYRKLDHQEVSKVFRNRSLCPILILYQIFIKLISRKEI